MLGLRSEGVELIIGCRADTGVSCDMQFDGRILFGGGNGYDLWLVRQSQVALGLCFFCHPNFTSFVRTKTTTTHWE